MEEKINNIEEIEDTAKDSEFVSEKEQNKTDSPNKLSYADLENVAHQLSEQSRNLYNKLQEANLFNMFKRLDYLYKTVELKDSFSKEFVEKAIKEIEDTLTIEDGEKIENK